MAEKIDNGEVSRKKGFLGLWVLASFIGWLASWMMTPWLEERYRAGVLSAIPIFAGAIVMALQWWFVMRHNIARSEWWVFSGVLGTAVGVGLLDYLIFPKGFFDPGLTYTQILAISGGISGVVIGFFVGGMQWFVLKARYPRAGWWVLVNMAAWPIGLIANFYLLGHVLYFFLQPFYVTIPISIFGSFLFPAVLTGEVLGYILRLRTPTRELGDEH